MPVPESAPVRPGGRVVQARACKALYAGSIPAPASASFAAQLHSTGDWRSLVARFPDTEEVTGSSPVSPTHISPGQRPSRARSHRRMPRSVPQRRPALAVRTRSAVVRAPGRTRRLLARAKATSAVRRGTCWTAGTPTAPRPARPALRCSARMPARAPRRPRPSSTARPRRRTLDMPAARQVEDLRGASMRTAPVSRPRTAASPSDHLLAGQTRPSHPGLLAR